MLKSELRGESKKQPLGRPLILGIFKKSSSPVQTAYKPSAKVEGFLCVTLLNLSGFWVTSKLQDG